MMASMDAHDAAAVLGEATYTADMPQRTRRLREADLLPTGRGRGGLPPMTRDWWANLVLSVLLRHYPALHVGSLVQQFGSAAARSEVGNPSELVGDTAFEAITGLIDASMTDEGRELVRCNWYKLGTWATAVDYGIFFAAGDNMVTFRGSPKKKHKDPVVAISTKTEATINLLLIAADDLAGRDIGVAIPPRTVSGWRPFADDGAAA